MTALFYHDVIVIDVKHTSSYTMISVRKQNKNWLRCNIQKRKVELFIFVSMLWKPISVT